MVARKKKDIDIKAWLIPQVTCTQEQREWVEKTASRSGNSLTSVVRNLVQDAINAEKSKEYTP